MRTLADRLVSGRTLTAGGAAPRLHFVADDLLPGAVSSWSDRIGGWPVGQVTSGNRPTCVANQLNGHSVVSFDGTDDRLTGSISTPQPLSIVAVVKSTDPTTTERIFYGSGTGTGQVQLGHVDGRWRVHAGGSAFFGLEVDGNWHVVCAAISGSDSLLVVDGVAFAGSLGTSYNGDTLVIGALGNQNGRWSGDLAELVVWDRRLDLSEFLKATDLFSRKYGI